MSAVGMCRALRTMMLVGLSCCSYSAPRAQAGSIVVRGCLGLRRI